MSKRVIKPFKSMNGKVFTATPEQLNKEVFAEINEFKVVKEMVSHSVEEKLKLKAARKAWNKEPKRCPEVIDALSKARTPRKWNVSVSSLQELA